MILTFSSHSHKVALTFRHELEHLRVLENVLSVVDKQLTSDKNKHGSNIGRGRLSVKGEDAVSNLGEGEVLP